MSFFTHASIQLIIGTEPSADPGVNAGSEGEDRYPPNAHWVWSFSFLLPVLGIKVACSALGIRVRY